jgi:polar amino acid transport system substrate-binding protein
MNHWQPKRAAGLMVLVVMISLAGCGGEGAPTSPVRAAPMPLPVGSPDPDDVIDNSCATATKTLAPPTSMPPPNAMAPGSFMARIHDRGYLIAGVPRGRIGFSWIDPADGEPKGFDIDMIKQISKAIFGDENHVEYRFVTTPERIPLVENGTIDVVSASVTITCGRWKQVAFASHNYDDSARIMVSKTSPMKSFKDLGKGKVCATKGSSSIYYLRHRANLPQSQVVEVGDNVDCLVGLQRGELDAIMSLVAVLDGLQGQDPSTAIVGPPIFPALQGMIVSLCHKDFARFINGVQDQMRADGRWDKLNDQWLKPWLGTPAPSVDYSDRSPDGPAPYACPAT